MGDGKIALRKDCTIVDNTVQFDDDLNIIIGFYALYCIMLGYILSSVRTAAVLIEVNFPVFPFSSAIFCAPGQWNPRLHKGGGGLPSFLADNLMSTVV